ncbi:MULTISPECIES: Wzz/FepE/Etk N-terminal domain-containing protein [unclassified Sinorhizobium]|uniref:Wzz/FepE/Etk N-terminal domain-containing protein n=1 Tax=unclassified Sinorhizobium TaxID=2613772 RepID=UPI003526079E
MSVLAWRHKTRLIFCTAAGMVLAAFYAQSLPRTYNATATLLLESRQAPSQNAVAQQFLDSNRADSELQIIRSERLLSAVFQSLNLADNPEFKPQPPGPVDVLLTGARSFVRSLMGVDTREFAKGARAATNGGETSAEFENDAHQAAFSAFIDKVYARRVGQSYVIEIDYTSFNPELPARIANAIVSGYILQSVASKEQLTRTGTDALQGRLDALNAQVDAAKEAMRQGLLPAIPTPDSEVRVIGAALPPLGPSGPRSSLITALGGLLGLFCGISTIAFGLVFDRRVRGAKELMQDTGVACLACVPDKGKWEGIEWQTDNQPDKYAVAIRDMRTAIDIACASQRNKQSLVIALVGSRSRDEVSALSSSLAQLIRSSGRYVTLFKAPSINSHDVDDTLADPAGSLADAAVFGSHPDQLAFQTLDGIAVLPIRSKNPYINLVADFHHPHVLRILSAARENGDVVLDLPDLDSSMDALALAMYADAVVVVATAGRTTTDEVKEMLERLGRASAHVIGTVINKART